jgi:bacterioferritin
MADTKDVIAQLNIILRNELTAINQYFLHARMYGHMGIKKLADQEYEESIDEMKHADAIVSRILFLEGLPNLQELGKLYIGETVEEMLQCDLKLEHENHGDLVKALKVCQEAEDVASEMLLEDILKSEEEHIDWLKQQLSLISLTGTENYITTQV